MAIIQYLVWKETNFMVAFNPIKKRKKLRGGQKHIKAVLNCPVILKTA